MFNFLSDFYMERPRACLAFYALSEYPEGRGRNVGRGTRDARQSVHVDTCAV